MPTQVRIYTEPKSLGDVFGSSSSSSTAGYLHLLADQASSPQSQSQSADAYSSQAPRSSLARRPQRAMSGHADKPKGGVTFAGQDRLPKLPIPDLAKTCERYLNALRPLQSAREHGETQAAVQDFLDGEAYELNEKLKAYAEGRTSYIEQFWYDSYLNYDNPVVLNLNPFFLLEDDPTPARNNQVTRAASLVVSALEFVRAVRKEELAPDTVKGQPLDMYQYSRMFGTARVPTDNGCQIEQDPESKHIIVMCHGQFYWFDVLDHNSDLIMTEKDVVVNLQTILDDAAQTPIQDAAKGALGILSTENRKTWSGLRDVLTRDEGSNNADCLSIVDSALFVLCLDYTEAATVADLCQNMLCGTNEVEKGVQIGTCTNRWYDKLQIIVCKNGSAGINFEHTGVDGHTVLRFASDVYTDTILRFARTINGQAPTLWASASPDPSRRDPESFGDVTTTPHKLEWDMSPELTTAVRFAESRLADLIGQNEFKCLDFGSYGKNFITSMGFSPDAFVQMAFQAAYYGLYGRVECSYEPAMTKFYLHGRTEAVRPVTDDSVRFVQTFWADNPAEQKVDALRAACAAHVNNTRQCAKAEGCDRHLYALYSLWQRLADEEASLSSMSSASSTAAADESQNSPIHHHHHHHQHHNDSVYTNGSSPTGDSSAPSSPNSLRGSNKGETLALDGEIRMVTRERGDSTTSRRGAGGSNGILSPVPALFADAGWDKLNNTILSTSNCGNPSLRHFGFGPVSGGGFGIGYIIKEDSIAICASSKHRQTKRLVDTLESYLLEIRRVLRIAATNARARAAEEAEAMSRATNLGSSAAGTAAAGVNGVGARGSPARSSLPAFLGGGKQTRAREVDLMRQGRSQTNRMKSRGRLIRLDSGAPASGSGSSHYHHHNHQQQQPLQGQGPSTEESMVLDEDDELGGYGFFDAGMLLQALKARGGKGAEAAGTGQPKPSQRAAAAAAAAQQARRRDVGKSLRLVEY